MKGQASLTSLSPLSFFTSYSLYKPKTLRFLQVRSQNFKDEGSSSNMVDANLGVLKARMEEVMRYEKLEYTTSERPKNIGWNHNSLNATDHDTQNMNGYATMMAGTIEVLSLIGGSFGLVFLVGSLSMFVVSALVHLCT